MTIHLQLVSLVLVLDFSRLRALFLNSIEIDDQPNSCWLWKRQLSDKCYGRVDWATCPENFAHRLSYRLFVGPIPRNRRILHSCNVRKCVNWNHLYAGTLSQNAIDMVLEGNQNNQKLSRDQVLEIRKMHASGLKPREIYQKFNLTYNHFYLVVNRICWRHLP